MLLMVIYFSIILISVDYDVTTGTTSRVHSSANKSDNFDSWQACLPQFDYRSEPPTTFSNAFSV